MRGNFVFTGCYRPGSSALLSWAGAAYIVWLAWKIATIQQRKTDFRQNQSAFGPALLAVCERQNHFVWRYGTVDVCPPQTQALSWVVGVSVLLAMIGRLAMCAGRWRGICFSDCFAVWSPVKYRAGAVAGLLCGTHFY